MSRIIKAVLLVAIVASCLNSIYSTPIREDKSNKSSDQVAEVAGAAHLQILDESPIAPPENEPHTRELRSIRMFSGGFGFGRPGYMTSYRPPSMLSCLFAIKRRIIGGKFDERGIFLRIF